MSDGYSSERQRRADEALDRLEAEKRQPAAPAEKPTDTAPPTKNPVTQLVLVVVGGLLVSALLGANDHVVLAWVVLGVAAVTALVYIVAIGVEMGTRRSRGER